MAANIPDVGRSFDEDQEQRGAARVHENRALFSATEIESFASTKTSCILW